MMDEVNATILDGVVRHRFWGDGRTFLIYEDVLAAIAAEQARVAKLVEAGDRLADTAENGGDLATAVTAWDNARGLTKREYAAIHIAAALAGRGVTFAGEDVAKRAVELADAVLKEAGE